MRFIARTLWGGMIVAACAVTLWMGYTFAGSSDDKGDGRPKRAAPERIYTVRDVTLTPVTATPTLTAFGEIEAWRVLELRAAAAGRIVDIAPDLREGVQTRAGETLVRIDPADLRAREADTLTVLADARSQQTEADQSLALARADLEAAIAQLKLRRSALQRQQQLVSRGVAAANSVEAPQLAASSAEQAVVGRRSAYVAAKQRVSQAASAIQRAQLSVQTARRDSADSSVIAPFAGVLTEVTATLGSLVSPNERLARLIDMRSLEAAFRVSDAQYSRLLNEQGGLAPLTATVSLKLGERTIDARATLDRPAAMVGDEGGRTVYARIETTGETPMRPGDFVSVTVTEPPLEQVAVIPARAATEDGRIFLIDDEGRLLEHRATILRRQPDTLIVTDVPFGERIVTERRPQLGTGIKVQSPEEAAAKEIEDKKKRAARRAARAGGGKPEGGEGERGGRPKDAKLGEGEPTTERGKRPEGERPKRPEGGKPDAKAEPAT